MTTAPAPEHPSAHEHAVARHPVQVDGDGDFALEDLLAVPAVGPARRINAVPTTLAALWRLRTAEHAEPTAGTERGTVTAHTTPSVPTEADAVLLHRVEASGLFRPPVRAQVAALTPDLGAAWLGLAARWVDLSRSCGDLRFLNAACKLTGAVWLHYNGADRAWREPDLTSQVAAVGGLLREATDRLRRRLAGRIVLAESASPSDETLCPGPFAGESRARIAVLAGSGSRSVGRLVTAATTAGLPIAAVCWYRPPHIEPTTSSNYSSAWYPPSQPDHSPSPDTPSSVPATVAESWEDVATALKAANADVVLLVGMPIVPDSVLGATRLGVLNAHNGALPTHRGMDAVGWAILNNQPVVCSLHLARPVVDAGEVIAAHPVPIAPAHTLAARVKFTQLRLLLAGAAHVATTGTLPDLTPQPAAGTQFYRLHPHLKRLLDASPYALNDTP